MPLIRPAYVHRFTKSYSTALGSRFRKSDPVRTELKFVNEELAEPSRLVDIPQGPQGPQKASTERALDEEIDSLFDALMTDTKPKEQNVPKLSSGETQEVTSEAPEEETSPTEYLKKSKLTPNVVRQIKHVLMGRPQQLLLATRASYHIATPAAQVDLWSHVMASLRAKKFEIIDINSLLTSIPLDIRAQFLPRIEGWIAKCKQKPTAVTYGQIMMGYAESGNVAKVEERFRQMIEADITPNVHTYAHRLKACDKQGDLKMAMEVFEDLKLATELYGIRPNHVIFTTLISTSLRNHKVELAAQIFEFMKYTSKETQPTTHTYNSLITASAIRSNTEKALDLFYEMKPKGVADVRTYQSLILACLRLEKYHLKAWELLLELREQHSDSFFSRQTLVVVFQAAAVTGDLAFLRSLYKQLCMSPDTYPDAILTQLLMQAYARYDTKSGAAASSALSATWGRLYGGTAQDMLQGFLFPDFQGMAALHESHPGLIPPFLPTTTVESLSFSRKHIISESRAIFQFLKTNKPQLLDEIAAIDYLKAGSRHRDFAEFLRRYKEVSVSASEGDGAVISPSDQKTYSSRQKNAQRYDSMKPFNPVLRTDNHFFVALNAIQSDCIADPEERDPNLNHPLRNLTPEEVNERLDFAQEVWVERGQWRKTDAFKKKYKTRALQISADYNFACKIINALAALKQPGEAAAILSSTPVSFNWRKKDLAFFHIIADAFYHEDALREITKAVYRERELHEAVRNPDAEKKAEFDIFSI